MDPQYGKAYRELFETHWWWRSRTEFVIDKLRELKPAAGWTNILDIGCGDGLYFDRLAEFGEVEGLEPSAELISADNPHRNRIHTCGFDASFQPGKQYSLILMLDVLEHLHDPTGALRHAVDLLAQDGLLVITVPAFMALWTQHDELNQHLTRYTKRTLAALAISAGLRIQEQRYLYHWMFLAKMGIALSERILPSKPKPPKIPPHWANVALFRLSRIEQKATKIISLPFGSSLMIVGGRQNAN